MQQRLSQVLESRDEILEGDLFSSHAVGRPQAHSDIDVGVYVSPDYALDQGFGYQSELTAAVMAALQTNDIDVVILNRAPLLLYRRVLAQGVRLMPRDLQATTTREGRARSRLCDFAPQLAKIEAGRRASQSG